MLFISPQKLVLFSRYLNFWVDDLVMQKNDLIRKIRLISKFITSQPGKQTNAIHIMPNISRSKDNQTMKFGQLIEHKMRNIFLEKSYTKCDGETTLRIFSSFSNLIPKSISMDQQSYVLYRLFLLYVTLRAIEIC